MLKMPVHSESETKKGVLKTKLSLSLNRNNATNLSNDIRRPFEKQDSEDLFIQTPIGNKENKPVKRPFNSVYSNTLNAAKKLKPLSEQLSPEEKVITKPVLLDLPTNSAMLNGHHASENQYGGSVQKKTPIATLANLGNTCFLNSVLYTLRYAPRFLHNLHHLVSDLARVEQKLGSIRLKSSSLGRSAAGLASSGARSWSSKDLLSLGQSDSSSGKSKIQIATEKLHETYLSLRAAESKCANSTADITPEPFAADAFLAALRDVNSTFEGNRQQDAHELLVCILDNIRETCRALSARASKLQVHENGHSNGIRQPSLDGDGSKTLGTLRKSWKKRKDVKTNDKRNSPTEERPPSPIDQEKDEKSRPGWDFVAEDFEGTMIVRTMCVECEAVTEKAQPLCELCVPVADDERDAPDEPFRTACLSTEYLRDQNKYWCSGCLRYNEARRSVAYSRLPRLLVLQLKRFSGGMEKITRHVPTPRQMPCFCEPCVRRAPDHPPAHRYTLWAVIMHLGQTLTGGHYVAYARDRSASPAPGPGPEWGEAGGEGGRCPREGAAGGDAAPPHSASGFMRSLFSRARPVTSAGCAARECCVPKPRPDACWLACDDDLVKPISDEEFEDLLAAEPKMRSAATPYLLFYVKHDVAVG